MNVHKLQNSSPIHNVSAVYKRKKNPLTLMRQLNLKNKAHYEKISKNYIAGF